MTATEHPDEERQPGALTPLAPTTSTDVTRFVVQTLRARTGRGPTKASAYVNEGAITVVLRDALSRLEETLNAHGHCAIVASSRRAAMQSIAPELCAGIAELTGSSVQTLLFDQHAEADIAALVFVLEDHDPLAST